MSEFGKRSYISGFGFQGPCEPEAVNDLILKTIDAIGMTPIFDSKVFHWTEDGIGYIHVQCLYESCVLADVWPKHNGGYLFVISCKRYNLDDVVDEMHRNGYTITVAKDFPLWL
jgi:hypothetical protein